MTIEWWMALLSGILLLAAGALLTFFQGWYRTRQRQRKDNLEQIQKLTDIVGDQAVLLGAVSDRMALQSRAVIAVATACKNGTPEQAARAIDIVTISETQFQAALTAHMTKTPKVVPEAEAV
jgi:hypothetical protein